MGDGDGAATASEAQESGEVIELANLLAGATQRKGKYIPPVPPREDHSVPIKGYDPMQGFPWPVIRRHVSVADAENRLIMVKLRETSEHIFNYMQPNTVRYFADLTDDQNMVASAYITLLEQEGVYGFDGQGKRANYTVSYDENARSLVFIADDKETARILERVGRRVQELVGGKEDMSISFAEGGHKNYGSTIAEEQVDFSQPDKPVTYHEVSGFIPAVIVRLRALGVTLNEETTEGKSLLDKLSVKINEWNTTGREDETAGIEVFNQHWQEMLSLIVHVPEGPGGAKERENRKKALSDLGYGDAASEFIMRGFPKAKFDTLVKEVGTEIKRETRRRHSGDIGSINAKHIGECLVPLIKEALDKGVYLTAESIINQGARADSERPSLDMTALDAAIRAEVERTAKAKQTTKI